MRHARIFENRAVTRRSRLRPRTLLIGGGNRTISSAIAQCETSMASNRLAGSLALKRRTEQNRGIEHIRLLRNHAIRQITTLRKPNQHLTKLPERRSVQQLYNAIADLGARAAALVDRAAVRIPVVTTDVRACMWRAEREIAGVVG